MPSWHVEAQLYLCQICVTGKKICAYDVSRYTEMLSIHNVVTNKTGKEGMYNAAIGLCCLTL
jgi:hypothetical protein